MATPLEPADNSDVQQTGRKKKNVSTGSCPCCRSPQKEGTAATTVLGQTDGRFSHSEAALSQSYTHFHALPTSTDSIQLVPQPPEYLKLAHCPCARPRHCILTAIYRTAKSKDVKELERTQRSYSPKPSAVGRDIFHQIRLLKALSNLS